MFATLHGMFDYRETLYSNYFNDHSGRGHENDEANRFNTQKRYFRREILPLLDVGKKASIVDLGCGTGSLVSMLQDEGFEDVRGVDVSEGQLKVAEKMGVKGLVKDDITQFLEKNPDQFDLITGIDIIEHLSKDELVKLLKVIQKALKPDGQVVFRTPNADAPLTSVYGRADFTHETHLNKSSAIQVMRAVGYHKIHVGPGLVFIENPLKELLRKFAWKMVLFRLKFMLFASGRTWHEVEFTPNILIRANRIS